MIALLFISPLLGQQTSQILTRQQPTKVTDPTAAISKYIAFIGCSTYTYPLDRPYEQCTTLSFPSDKRERMSIEDEYNRVKRYIYKVIAVVRAALK